MSTGAETCFELQKPVVGKPAGRVCITPYGEFRIEHRLLKAPVVFAADRVQAVVDASGPLELDVPALEREPVAVHLPRDGFTSANFGFVFRSPVHVGPFKYGAQQLIPLSRSKRRAGIEVDLLSLTVAEPALLLQAARAMGVGPTSDIGESLSRSISPVAPELEAEVLEGRRRSSRRVAWKILGVGLLIAALTAARVGVEVSWETMSRLVLASVAAGALAGMAFAITRPNPSTSSGRKWAAWIGYGLALLVLLGAAVEASKRVAGARYILLWATVAALLAAPVIGRGLRALAMTEPVTVEGDLLVAHRRGWREAAAIVLIAALAIAGSAFVEESAARPVRAVQAALIDEDDLPEGWETCCGSDQILRGDSLDEHICGGDDEELPAHVAAVKRSFNKPSPGHEENTDAHIDMTVLVAPTEADAIAEFAAINSEDYWRCNRTSVIELATYWQPASIGPGIAEYEGREIASAPSNIIVDKWRATIPVAVGNDVEYVYFVRARIGRAIVRMPILVFVPSEVSDEERQAVTKAALEEVRAADL